MLLLPPISPLNPRARLPRSGGRLCLALPAPALPAHALHALPRNPRGALPLVPAARPSHRNAAMLGTMNAPIPIAHPVDRMPSLVVALSSKPRLPPAMIPPRTMPLLPRHPFPADHHTRKARPLSPRPRHIAEHLPPPANVP